jgi:chemotaxis protein CheC
MDPLLNYPDFKLDIIKEIGNIGAGNAATALSILLDKPIDIGVPKVKVMPFDLIPDITGNAEQEVIAVFLAIEGSISGNIFFILTHHSARQLMSSIMTFNPTKEAGFNEMEQSAMQEIGNIMAGSFLSSLADFTHLTMYPTVPSLAIDMVGAVLSYGLIEMSQLGDHALLIDTKFIDVQAKEEVEGHFFLIPDPSSMEKIFSALGVPPS